MSLLSSLLARTTLDDHEEILKAANEALKKSKTDIQARRTRAVALLKLDRFDDALRAFEDGDGTLRHEAQLEYAYALFKNGKYDEAAKIAKSNSTKRSFRHIESQSNYRLERFGSARECYTRLATQASAGVGEENDLRVNSGATDAQLFWCGLGHLTKKIKADREDLEHFETAFNSACGYIARGEWKQGSTLLTRAKDLCVAADELSDEEKRAELLPILAQQVYVMSRLGQIEEARRLSSILDVEKISDHATRHIAQTNALMLTTEPLNPFLAHRLFYTSSQMSPTDHPFKYQSSILHRNALTLDFQTGKLSGSGPKGLSNYTQRNLSPQAASAGVFKAAAHVRGLNGNSALRKVLALLEKNPIDPGVLLTAVHLYVLSNNLPMAATILTEFFARLEKSESSTDLDMRFAPGLVALQASMDSKLNRITHAKAEISKAVSYWRDRSANDLDIASLLAAAGMTLLQDPTSDERKAANKFFHSLDQQNPNDPAAAAGLAATSDSKEADAEALGENIMPVKELIAGADAAALEASGIAKLPSKIGSVSKKRPATYNDGKPSKPKKIRPSKMPKDFEANKKMDPERWLPLRDRTNWRPKGKKKRRTVAGLMSTQGGVGDDSRPVTPSQTITQKAGQSKKKKGKK